MYRTLVGIGVICAVIIVSVFEATQPVINVNKQQALEQAIFQVLPQVRSFAAYGLDEQQTLKPTALSNTLRIYAGFDKDNNLTGFAIPAQGMGYQDSIQLLYGYSIQARSIEGVVILQSRETPGLGSKIESQAFLHNFNGVEMKLEPSSNNLVHALELVKTRDKHFPWQVDAITGATVSSRAVVSIMNRSLAYWLPLINNAFEGNRNADNEN